MLGKDIFFFFFFAESRSGLHIWDVSLTSSNCRIRPLYPSFFPGKSSIFQTSAFAFSSQAVALRKCYLVCKAMFVAVLLVSSSAAPLAEVPSSVTAVCPGRCTGSPSQAWGFPLGLAFLLPSSHPIQGQASWGKGVVLAESSRAHLAAAAPPQYLCPGRPRLSSGGPPAARPGTGGPDERPAGGLPCGGGRGGPNQREGRLGMEEGHFGVASLGTPRGHAAPP